MELGDLMHPLIEQRWSPRWFDSSVEVTDAQLAAMLEAARWAPSYGNTQPARYIVGRRGDGSYEKIFESLSRRNQNWAQSAPALLVAVAVTVNAKGDLPLWEYGVGLATENLVLQAVSEGLVAHQMGGFNAEAVRVLFQLPAEAKPIVAIAVGKLGDRATIPDDVRDRELAVRKRLPLSEIAFTGEWGKPFTAEP
ncbi:nitroreductase [Kibdelosporangium banguiense]|uniref:Nitroreductase n=1 Tax=Kibdelosporangium banguiense TaxID=1365924 RepID=A0ABS4TAR6_9PSEU|nr:nitroreductase family protein [Kibdelosporangium banguiense]MBP2321511.1 nitroreductase [Kibdelosporangium banguiense]